MHGFQRLEEGDELGREFLECGDLRCEEGVPAGGRGGKEEEGGEPGWLEFIGDIGVPDGGSDTVVDFEVEALLSVPRKRDNG